MTLSIQDFINSCFVDNASSLSIAHTDNYPFLFQPILPHSPFIIEQKGSIVAACTLFPSFWYHNNRWIQGVAVGNVCVSPQHRKQGLGTQLLQGAQDRAQKWGADFCYLFSEPNAFYAQSGYAPFGSELFLGLVDHDKQTFTSFFMPDYFYFNGFTAHLSMEHISRLWKFIIKYGSERCPLISHSLFCQIMTIPQMEVFVMENGGGEIESLCFLGKGGDFQNTLHGFAFTALQSLYSLVGYVLGSRPMPQLMVVSNWPQTPAESVSCHQMLLKPLQSLPKDFIPYVPTLLSA